MSSSVPEGWCNRIDGSPYKEHNFCTRCRTWHPKPRIKCPKCKKLLRKRGRNNKEKKIQ